MGIPKRIQPKQEPQRRPTRGEVEAAAAAFANLLGLEEGFVSELVEFATRSVSTCWAVVAYARHLIRCQVAEVKIKGQIAEVAEKPLREFDQVMSEAREKDFTSQDTTRTLRGIPQGRPLQMGVEERAVVVSKIKPLFAAPPRTPVEVETDRVVVGPEGRNLRLGDWLISQFLSGDDLQQYVDKRAKAREADRAERASSGEPKTEEESDEDPSDVADGGNGTAEFAPAAS